MWYGSNHLTMWTVQPVSMWEEMQRTGWLRADGRRSMLMRTDPSFREAYDWMRKQMRERIPGYRGRYPIWAWHDKMPRKRDYADHDPSEPQQVRIKFRAAPGAVLLSSFDAWHAVLNYWFIGPEDMADVYMELRREELTPEMAARLEASWRHVFDIPKATEYRFHIPGATLQGVIEEVHISQVSTVHSLF